MASEWLIWHNPKCSTSRFVLQALRDAGLQPVVRDYQKDPPSAEELHAAVNALGGDARRLLRRKSPLYAELGLAAGGLSDDDLIAAMADNPGVVERPLVCRPDGSAVMCRPKETVFQMLEDPA